MYQISELVNINGDTVLIADNIKSPNVRLINEYGGSSFKEAVLMCLDEDEEIYYGCYQEVVDE